MYEYQQQGVITSTNETEEIIKLQKREEFYKSIVEKFMKRKGRNSVSCTVNTNQTNLIINGNKEQVIERDIYWVKNGEVNHIRYGDTFNIIIRGKYKISIVHNDEVFFWGYNKFPNEIEKIMLYVKSDYMELLLYMDTNHNVYPIVEFDYADKLLEYDMFLEDSSDEVNHSWIKNLYNALSNSSVVDSYRSNDDIN